MQDTFYIYKLTFPNGKVYIGQTKNFIDRMKRHGRLYSLTHNNYLSNAIKKYKWENVTKEILIECNVKLIDFFECSFIDEYNSINRKLGYNIEPGGRKNKIVSEESKEKNRKSNGGKNHPMYGKKHSLETIERMRFSKLNKEVVRKFKPISVYDIHNNLIKEFKCIKYASKEFGIDCGSICGVLKGRRKSSHNLIFKYSTENLHV